MLEFTASNLKKLSYQIFIEIGAKEKESKILADHLVENNLVGHDSHGIILIPRYIEKFKKGELNLNGGLKLVKSKDNMVLFDAELTPGPVSGKRGMKKALQLAEEYGIGSVGIKNSHHTGRLGAYTTFAAKNNMVGIACTSWATPEAMGVVPFKGKEGRISTNPISVAAPRDKTYPFLVDMATSVVAAGKIKVAQKENKKVPEGWIINADGEPTNNPEEFFSGGYLLPMGGDVGYKGYALGLIVEIFSGILSGNKPMQKEIDRKGMGLYLEAIKIDNYISIDEFINEIEKLFTHVKDTPTIKESDKILIPGEPEYIEKEKRMKKGIKVPKKVWEDILNVCEELDIKVDDIIKT